MGFETGKQATRGKLKRELKIC